MGVRYATREAVKAATDAASTNRMNARVDDALEAASRTIDRRLGRTFWPQHDTRTVRATSSTVWLGKDEAVAVTSVTDDNGPLGFTLRPYGTTPTTRLDLDSAPYGLLTITGVFGYSADETPVGGLVVGVDTDDTVLRIPNAAAVGVGDLLRIGTERMIVTGRGLVSTAQTATTTANKAARVLPVQDGDAFHEGETLTLGGERMRVEAIAGDTLLVERGVDGSTLEQHTGAQVYLPRALTVQRAACGTTGVEHDEDAAIYRHDPPGPIRTLCQALALVDLGHQAGGYARTQGAEGRARDASTDLSDLWAAADSYRRKARMVTV